MNMNIFKHSINFYREIILKYGICLLVFFLPLVVFPNYFFYYISSKTFFLYGIVSVLFPLWLYTIYIDKSYRLSRKQLFFFIPLVLYIAWMTISGIFAVNPHLSFWSTFERGTGLITLYFALASSFIVASVVKKEGASYIYLILKFLLISSFILSVTIWLSDRGFNLPFKIFSFSSGGGLIGNPSISSAFLIFSIFSGIYLLISKTINKYWKIAIYIILATILLSPSFINIYSILTNKNLVEISKGAFTGIIVGIGVIALGYLSLSKNKTFRNVGIASIFISLIIFSFGWASFVTPGTYLHEKFTQVSLNTRFILWDISQKSMSEHPVLGYGPENFSIAFQDKFNPKLFTNEFYNETINDKAHNFYYDTGVSGGYPAIILYAFLFLSILYAIYEAYKKNSITKLYAGVLFGLFLAYLFQNLFFFDSNVTIFYFFTFIGIVYGLQDHHKIASEKEMVMQKKARSEDSKLIILLLIVASCASLLYFVILPSQKAILLQSVVSTPFKTDKSLIYENLLNSASIGNDRDVSSLSDIIFREYSYNLTHSVYQESDIPKLGEDVKLMFNYLESVSKTNTTDIRLQIALLRFNSIHYFLSGTEASKDSLLILDKAHNQSPSNPEIYWWEAQIYFWHADIENAINSYKKAIALNPYYGISHKMLIQFAKDTNNKKLFDEALLQAKKDIPGFNFW